jgi:hypothetical protein
MTEITTLAGEFVAFIIQIVLWMIVWHFVLKVVRVFMDKENPAEREALVQKVMTMIHQIKQEQHGELTYWFDAETDAFLAQGKDDTEIKEHLKGRFKGHIFLLDETRAWAGPDLKLVPISELAKSPEMVPKI